MDAGVDYWAMNQCVWTRRRQEGQDGDESGWVTGDTRRAGWREKRKETNIHLRAECQSRRAAAFHLVNNSKHEARSMSKHATIITVIAEAERWLRDDGNKWHVVLVKTVKYRPELSVTGSVTDTLRERQNICIYGYIYGYGYISAHITKGMVSTMREMISVPGNKCEIQSISDSLKESSGIFYPGFYSHCVRSDCVMQTSDVEMWGNSSKLSMYNCRSQQHQPEGLSRTLHKFSLTCTSKCIHFNIKGRQGLQSVGCKSIAWWHSDGEEQQAGWPTCFNQCNSVTM